MVKKETTIIDIEGLMSELYTKLKDNNLSKKEHTEIVKKLKYLEQHYRSVQDKKINGKKYPKREVPPIIIKEEVLKLIDSVEGESNMETEMIRMADYTNNRTVDLSGVSVGKNRFIEIDQDIDIRTHEK